MHFYPLFLGELGTEETFTVIEGGSCPLFKYAAGKMIPPPQRGGTTGPGAGHLHTFLLHWKLHNQRRRR